MQHFRAVGKRRIGGILVPFNRVDKKGTYWTRASDFMFDLFFDRPLFFYHNFDERAVGRAGTFDNAAFRMTEQGLYAEADVDATPLGDLVLNLVDNKRAAFSSGAWPTPNTLKVRRDGFVERWAIVEGSVCEDGAVYSLPGTTMVSHVRGSYPAGEELLDTTLIERSMWVMNEQEETSGAGAQPVATNGATAPAANVPQVSQAQIQSWVGSAVQSAIEDLPVRGLPPGGLAQQPVIQVSSQYDDVSLLGMLVYDEMNRKQRARRGIMYRRSEEFMRALVDKARVQHERDQKSPLPAAADDVRTVPFRAVTPDVFRAWHEVVPHLRADEALQSTLASQGDELVPTLLNSAAWYFFRMESKVFGLFDMFDMPSNPFDYPTFTTGIKLRSVGELTDRGQFSIPSSPIKTVTIGTSKKTFSAGELGALTIASKRLFQEGGINVADAVAQYLVREVAANLDYMVINGDERTAATNISNSADPTDTVYDGVLELDGLRRIAQAADSGNDFAAHATISADTPATLSKLMGSRGIIGRDIRNLALICDPGSAYKFDALADYENLNEVGNQATLLNGQVGQVKGVPIVVSDEVEYTDANGLYPADHTSGTKGQLIQVHRPGIKIGRMQDVVLDVMDAGWAGGSVWWVTTRFDVQQMEDGHVAVGYNVTV